MYYKRIIDNYLSEWASRKVNKPIVAHWKILACSIT